MTDFEKGFICGLIIGEGSFTGDKKRPALQVRMHTRSKDTLKKMLNLFPGSKLNGPYLHQGRNYCIWALRGQPLKDSIIFLNEISNFFDSHVKERYENMKIKYNLNQ